LIAISIALTWILVISSSLYWNLRNLHESIKRTAVTSARESFNKDVLYRRWNAMKGGVYVPVSKDTPPNPYLKGIAERDVTTTTGKHLTLVNPAYMTRQVHELARETTGVRGHITSLMPIRPANRADSWETKALKEFEEGVSEEYTIETMNGRKYLRFMKPLITEESCLKCHAAQGYKVGDIRGGISVTLPFEPYLQLEMGQKRLSIFLHIVIGLLGLVGLWVALKFIYKEVEARLESEERLRALVDTIPDSVCLEDEKGRWIETNKVNLDLLGLSEVDYHGKTNEELAEYSRGHGESVIALGKWDEEALEKGEPVRFDLDFVEPGGSRKHFDVIKVPLLDEKGKRKGVVIVGRDLTELKEVLDFQELLIKLATKFINLPIEKINDGIESSLAAVGDFLKTDRAYLFRYDLTRGIMTNTHEWCASGIEPQAGKFRDIPLEGFEKWLGLHSEGKMIHLPENVCSLNKMLELKGVKSLIALPLFSFSKCFGFIGFDSIEKVRQWSDSEIALLKILAEIYTNAERFVQAEEEKEKLQIELFQDRKLKSIGKLASGIAHDLNNMLSPILGYSELILQTLDDTDPREEDMRHIVHSAERARDIVKQLLTFSRKQTLQVRPLDLNEVVEHFRKLLRHTIREDIEIKLELTPSLPKVIGNRGQLEQVIMNLVINAQDAIEGRGIIRIRTSSERDERGGAVVLSVIDNGRGMEEEIQANIFDPFFTTKEIWKGTGLGLSTVYGIVKNHDGEIKVTSTSGVGTRFDIYLPVFDENSEPVEDRIIKETVGKNKAEGRVTILLVEDDYRVRAVTRRMLTNKGYSVIVAEKPQEAINLVEKEGENIDILLTDVIMPEMNGVELYKKVSEIKTDIKVLFMSGYTNNTISMEGLVAGRINLIQKPFSAEELTSSIGEVLEG